MHAFVTHAHVLPFISTDVLNTIYIAQFREVRCREEHEGHLEFDLGNLMAYDPSAIDAATFKSGVDQTCQSMATSIFQALAKRLFALPSEPAPVGRIAELPAPVTTLPREKPIPKPRPPTKWELFAQKKGIVKRKRSKLVLDEPSGEFKRRYGYGKANDSEAVPVIEAGPNDQPGEDPFSTMRKEKKERVKKQQKQQLNNVKASIKSHGAGVLPPTVKLAASLPEHGKGKPIKRKEMHGELKAASRQAGTSTASMGKFDKLVAGEKLSDRQPVGKRQKFMSLTGGGERETQGKMVDSILRKNADDIIDVGRAISKLEAVTREVGSGPRMKMKGANKKGRISGGGKGKKPPPSGGPAGKGQKGGRGGNKGGKKGK